MTSVTGPSEGGRQNRKSVMTAEQLTRPVVILSAGCVRILVDPILVVVFVAPMMRPPSVSGKMHTNVDRMSAVTWRQSPFLKHTNH
jgi:hypothetical protein